MRIPEMFHFVLKIIQDVVMPSKILFGRNHSLGLSIWMLRSAMKIIRKGHLFHVVSVFIDENPPQN